MNVTILSIDTINGTRTSTEVHDEKVTISELNDMRKELLKKLHDEHPEMDEKDKKRNLEIVFKYREETLNPDPFFMPKPLCECGETAIPQASGEIVCKCGKQWYDWKYDVKKWMEKNGR